MSYHQRHDSTGSSSARSREVEVPPSPSIGSPRSRSASTTHPSPLPDLARPSSLSLRPHLDAVQTRIRARSVTSGSGSSAPTLLQLQLRQHLSPTLAGSPILPGYDSFLSRNLELFGAPSIPERIHDEPQDMLGGGEEGSTENDSLPATPADLPIGPGVVVAASGDDSDSAGVSKQSWKMRGAKLEHASRIGVRRGRSFTSLLISQPSLASPTMERSEIIFEDKEPSQSGTQAIPFTEDIESAVFPPPSLTTLCPPELSPAKTLRSFLPELGLLAFLFLASFALILYLISTLPNLSIPHTLSDIPRLTSALETYRQTSYYAGIHLFTVLTALFLWKQCFSIPGSVLTNVLFGALYGTAAGTMWACVWTAVGSTGAYGIARLVSPLVEYYFATPLGVTRRALHLQSPSSNLATVESVDSSSQPSGTEDLFSHLLLARLFPLLPYSVLNVICGTLAIPIPAFFITLVLGSFPFNFSTCSVGSVVSLSLSSSTPLGETLWSKDVIVKLVAVTFVSVLPLVFKDRLKRSIASRKCNNLSFSGLMKGLRWRPGNGNRRDRFARLIGISGSGLARSGTARRKWNKSWAPGDDELPARSWGTLGRGNRDGMSRWEVDGGQGEEQLEALLS